MCHYIGNIIQPITNTKEVMKIQQQMLHTLTKMDDLTNTNNNKLGIITSPGMSHVNSEDLYKSELPKENKNEDEFDKQTETQTPGERRHSGSV